MIHEQQGYSCNFPKLNSHQWYQPPDLYARTALHRGAWIVQAYTVMFSEMKTLTTDSFTKSSWNFFSTCQKRKLFKVASLFSRETNYSLSIIYYLHTSETKQYFAFRSPYCHPLNMKLLQGYKPCGEMSPQWKTITMLYWKRRDNSYSDVSKKVFYTHTCKIFGIGQGSIATYSCFSSFGNLCFCKMLSVMPLSCQGKPAAITLILTIRTRNETITRGQPAVQMGSWADNTLEGRVQKVKLPLEWVTEVPQANKLPGDWSGQGADTYLIPKAPMLIHSIKVLLFLVIKLFWPKNWVG